MMNPPYNVAPPFLLKYEKEANVFAETVDSLRNRTWLSLPSVVFFIDLEGFGSLNCSNFQLCEISCIVLKLDTFHTRCERFTATNFNYYHQIIPQHIPFHSLDSATKRKIRDQEQHIHRIPYNYSTLYGTRDSQILTECCNFIKFSSIHHNAVALSFKEVIIFYHGCHDKYLQLNRFFSEFTLINLRQCYEHFSKKLAELLLISEKYLSCPHSLRCSINPQHSYHFCCFVKTLANAINFCAIYRKFTITFREIIPICDA